MWGWLVLIIGVIAVCVADAAIACVFRTAALVDVPASLPPSQKTAGIGPAWE
jgi:hypothetical protein